MSKEWRFSFPHFAWSRKKMSQLSCVSNPRRLIEIGNLIFYRKLSDSTGGNLSMRVDNRIYITPRYMGEKAQWQIRKNDLILTDLHRNVLEGSEDQITREAEMHFSIYESFPEIGAIIHAHPENILVFACSGEKIPVCTEMVEFFGLGEIELIESVPGASKELAINVTKYFQKREDELKKHGLAVMLPKHGVVTVAKDINEAFVILECIETNAKVVLMQRLLHHRW